MTTDWDLDWSHALLLALLERARAARRVELLGDAEVALTSGEPMLFVRHDVDLSLARAHDLALWEADIGVRSTYHVMWRSPFYDPTEADSRKHLAAIRAAGHEVGLHFFADPATGVPAPDALETALAEDCARLEDLLGAPVRSLSFHLPPPNVIKGPLRLAGRVNAYAKELLGWYLSDSRGRWREGDPRESLARPRGDVLQLLVHPIWWAAESAAPEIRLGAFVAEIAKERGRPFEEIAELAWDHILFRAKKPS